MEPSLADALFPVFVASRAAITRSPIRLAATRTVEISLNCMERVVPSDHVTLYDPRAGS